jgi:Ion transport protein
MYCFYLFYREKQINGFGHLLYFQGHYCMAHGEILQMNGILNIILTSYFTLELLIKVMGLGPMGYLSDGTNVFDAAVAISSVAELIVFLRGGGRGALSVFRAFRLMRVFKLARRWEELNKIVQTIFKSISSISYLSLLLLVFIFIMALLGMQMFGYKCATTAACHHTKLHQAAEALKTFCKNKH